MESYIKTLLLSLLSFTVFTLSAQKSHIYQGTTFSYGGYVKFDGMYTHYSDGLVSIGNPLRDFIFPSQIPVGEGVSSNTLDFHVKESRFNFGVTSIINKEKVHGYLEMDFLLASQGNERVSNSFNPRLRHFYLEWRNLLIGQTWSTFMIVVLPDDIDFIGALEGVAFARQPLIRYTHKSWMFAIENPTSTYHNFGSKSSVVSPMEVMPDLVIRKNFSTDRLNWSIAGIYRTLSAIDSSRIQLNTSGYGITTGGKLKIGNRKDDIRMMATYGAGLGRYVGANFIGGAYIDANGELQSLQSVNGYLAFNHYWTIDKWSSSFNVGVFQALNAELVSNNDMNDLALSYSGNIKYNPLPSLRFGLELTYAERALLNNISGSMFRCQFSVKYVFGYTDESVQEK